MRKHKEREMRGWSQGCLLIAICAAVTSCIPEPLPVDQVPTVEPQIVVISQFVPDNSIVIFLTRTFGALQADEDSDAESLLKQIAVTDASVKITGPEQSYTLTALGNGAYGGVMIPFEAGHEYQLDVSSVSLGNVTAVAKVQQKISFESITAKLYSTGFDDTLAEVTHKFNDPIGKNWYMINVKHLEREDITEDLLNPGGFTKLIEDTNFDGQQYSETFKAFQRNFSTGDTVAVFLSNISEDYFKFMNLRQDSRFSFVEYLGEPANYPSNIQGGKGFFNLYIPDIRLFVLEPMP